jgi:hypothetical protein
MSYENPAGPSGGSPGSSYFDAYDKASGLSEQERANRERVKLQKERDRQNQIANMQKMQYDIDMAQVKTLQVLDKIEKPDGLDNEVTAILRDRINVASAAQMYLMTDFSDDKKRQLAKQEIANYQNLLNLTTNFASSWDDVTTYWQEQNANIGKTIALQGDSAQYEPEANQWLINAMSGKMPSANIALSYDKDKNDLFLKVSGKDGNGNIMPTRTISANAWMELDDSDDNDFIQEIPQISQEFQAMLGPDNFNLITNNNGLNQELITNQEQTVTSNTVNKRKRSDITSTAQTRTTYNLGLPDIGPLPKMIQEANKKVFGAMSNLNDAKNFYEYNLGMLDSKTGPKSYGEFLKAVENSEAVTSGQRTVDQEAKARMSRILIDQTLGTLGLKSDDPASGIYYKDTPLVTKNETQTGDGKGSGSGSGSKLTEKERAAKANNQTIDRAINSGDLTQVSEMNNIKISRGGAANYYTVTKSEPLANGEFKEIVQELYIPKGDISSRGAVQLKRILGLVEARDFNAVEYDSNETSSTGVAQEVLNELSSLEDDEGIPSLLNKKINVKGKLMSIKELTNKIEGFDIDDTNFNELALTVPGIGKTKYSLPLSEADKESIMIELEIVALENL